MNVKTKQEKLTDQEIEDYLYANFTSPTMNDIRRKKHLSLMQFGFKTPLHKKLSNSDLSSGFTGKLQRSESIKPVETATKFYIDESRLNLTFNKQVIQSWRNLLTGQSDDIKMEMVSDGLKSQSS